MNDLIFSLDPSSTRTGWALLGRAGQLLQAGLLLPDKVRSEPQFRILRMADDLRQLLNELAPGTVVIEITSGKVGTNRHKGSGAGLGVYGMAVGFLWAVAECWLRQLPAEQRGKTEIVLVKENDWTNRIPKTDRIAAVAAEFSEYESAKDPNGDVADAIALGLWWLKEFRVQLEENLK